MNVNLQSKNISLIFDYGVDVDGNLMDDLWTTLRRNAVEAGQASSPDLASFADECLLCAQIVTNVGVSDQQNEEDVADTGDSLWDPSPSPSTSVDPPTSNSPVGQRAGLVYLHASPANVPAGETNIGVIINPTMRRRGYAREAVQLVLRWAFEEFKFHRVQAAILDTQYRDRAMRLFIGSGFSHEGTKRRAVYQPEGEGVAGMWKDVTYLAMLDTDWVLKSTWIRPENPVITTWDEMFARHARESEELLRWEEKHGRVWRSSSTETLRENNGKARNAQDMAYLTDDDTTSFGNQSMYGSVPPSPRPNVFITWDQDEVMADDFSNANLDQRWEEVRALQARRRRQDVSGLLEPSTSGRLLALPSIPSTHLSDVNSLSPHSQSPLTIPTPTTTIFIPPPSPSPSSTPSASHDSWIDSGAEVNWSFGGCDAPAGPSVPITIPFDPPPQPRSSASLRSRSGSSSSSISTDSWSDAQSSVVTGSNSWDVISNVAESSATRRGHM